MLTHKGTQTIATERLLLRRFRPDDAPAMFANWANDAAVTRFLTWEPHGSVDVTRQLLEDWCRAYQRPDVYNWAMEFAGILIGSISVVRVDARSESAELGYCMAVSCWNKGLMPEAVEAVIRYLFAEVGFHRIEIAHAVQNPASGRVAQKCGLTYEGTKKEAFRAASGAFLDIAYYGVLRKDWLPGNGVSGRKTE